MKSLYWNGEYQVKLDTLHKDLGQYQVLTFKSISGHFMRKTINPVDYNQYTDTSEFIKHL